MGCFNSKGFISGLSIRYNDPVVCIIGDYNKEFQTEKFYTIDQVRPWMLPVFGEYDDYGSIKNIEGNAASNILEKVTRLEDEDLEDFFKLIGEIRGSDRDLLDTLKRLDADNDENEVKIRSFLEKYNPKTNLILLMEHKSIYEDLIKTPKHTKFFDEYCNLESEIYKASNTVPSIFNYIPIIEFWNNEKLVKEYKSLQEKYDCSFNRYFFNWHRGLGFYDLLTDYNFWGEPGFSKELSELQAFDVSLLNLGLGYNTPFGFGSQEDKCEGIIDFYKKCISFYENNISV